MPRYCSALYLLISRPASFPQPLCFWPTAMHLRAAVLEAFFPQCEHFAAIRTSIHAALNLQLACAAAGNSKTIAPTIAAPCPLPRPPAAGSATVSRLLPSRMPRLSQVVVAAHGAFPSPFREASAAFRASKLAAAARQVVVGEGRRGCFCCSPSVNFTFPFLQVLCFARLPCVPSKRFSHSHTNQQRR